MDAWMVPPEGPPSVGEHALTCFLAVAASGRARLRGWSERGGGDRGGGRGSGSWLLGIGRSCCVQRAGRPPLSAAISSPLTTIVVSSCFMFTSFSESKHAPEGAPVQVLWCSNIIMLFPLRSKLLPLWYEGGGPHLLSPRGCKVLGSSWLLRSPLCVYRLREGRKRARWPRWWPPSIWLAFACR